MESKPFYCRIVGARITSDLCERRIKQAKEFRGAGKPHASLNKCIICKGLVPTETPTVVEKNSTPLASVAEILCPHCERPKVYKKLRWNKKHGMHVNCYYTASKKGKEAVVVEPKPRVDVEVMTVKTPGGTKRKECVYYDLGETEKCGDCNERTNCGIVIKPAADSVSDTLAERGKRYGEYQGHARIAQNIKRAMADSPNWALLSDDKKEALEMIAHKIGRILNGDPEYADSWHDIRGYAKLVEGTLS